MTIAPVLLFGYGNPSRGDDALGPAFLERIDALRDSHPEWPALDLLTDFQLQIEHVLDMRQRSLVLFVDADAAARPPFAYGRVRPARGCEYTTHALKPAELLDVYGRVVDAAPPPSFLLGIRADRFELGAPVSPDAARNLERAVDFAADLLAHPDPARWEACAHA